VTLLPRVLEIDTSGMSELSRFLFGVAVFFFAIVLPLLLYLKRRAVTNRRIVSYFFLIYALWYLPYSPIHEGCHFLVGRLSGLNANSYQLMPRFWRGDFVNGYIDWSNGDHWQILLSCQAPYLVDGLAVLLGYYLFRKRADYGPLLGALLLTQVFLRSVFDVAVNYFGGTLGKTGDFHYPASGYTRLAIHVGAWMVMLLGCWGALHEIMNARPTNNPEEQAIRLTA
jgi:hypothetical protein